ncbi:MAG TPA: hypothetical protein VKY27_01345 [Bacteriovoracaceae bacterium]|nr:hypothetical protein [Bacteriovoracaceae bacterium]
MNFLNLLEEKVNQALWRLIYFIGSRLPSPVVSAFYYLRRKFKHGLIWIKIFPWILLKQKNKAQKCIQDIISEIDFKTALGAVESKFKVKISHQKILINLHRYFLILCHLTKRPFRDFTPQQTLALIMFTVSSFAAGFLILLQTQRIYKEETKHLRKPASVEVIEYDRPAYYKEEFRHVQINGVRIPVYYPQINELQTVTIDFNVTLGNRIGRAFIERREFAIRDHLVQTLEPTLAQYSLDEEGKLIIKEKIASEIQEYLDLNEIDSEVKDVTLIYILAN